MKVKINTTTAAARLANNHINHSLARASDGRIWILWIEDGAAASASLLVAYSDDNGRSWTEETVVSNSGALSYVPLFLLIDSNDLPIVIFRSSSVAANYVDRSGGTWGALETITGASSIRSACIDSGDNIHLVYSSTGTRYIVGTSGAWGASELVEAGVSDNFFDIAVATNGEPYIAYDDGSSDNYHMRYRTGGTWQAEETFMAGESDAPMLLAIDSNDDVYVVFSRGGANAGIWYNKRTGGSWDGEVQLTSAYTAGYQGMIIIDTTDNVYFVYQYRAADENVYYRQLTAAGVLGSEQTLDDDISRPNNDNSVYGGMWAQFPSSSRLAEALQPVVVLLDETDSVADLYYVATSLPPAVQTNPATSIVRN